MFVLTCIPPALGFKLVPGREEASSLWEKPGPVAVSSKSQLPLIKLGYWLLCLAIDYLRDASAQC